MSGSVWSVCGASLAPREIFFHRSAIVDYQFFIINSAFLAYFKLSAANPRGASQEELALHVPFQSVTDVAAYRIAVGLKPSQQELEFNRRAGVR